MEMYVTQQLNNQSRDLFFFRVTQSRGVGAKVIKYSKNIWSTTLDGITRPLPFPNLPRLQKANWRYAAFLKLSIQYGQKLIS